MIMTTQQQNSPAVMETLDENLDDSSTSVIVFEPGAQQCCHEIRSRRVNVFGSAGTHDHGSSKVKLKNIVDYKWEVKNYPGHLIAVHIDGKHIAYVINVNNKVRCMEGMIRVVNTQTGQRALIKGMSGEVLDLQFAHIEDRRILGSIDASGLYVHSIGGQSGTLYCMMLIKVEDPLTNYTPKYDKISWCPFIETPSEEDDPVDSHLVVWTRGSMFQCFHMTVIMRDFALGTVRAANLTDGYVKFHKETITISWVTLSPDGSTLGVGSTDGMIRFYQIYMHEQEPRCLHQWKPHDGKPISSFFFLDNLSKPGAESYWKHAITGASNNTEFKVWDCGTWDCLQTLNIKAGLGKTPPYFIAEIDRTASYLVLSSREARTLYVIQIANNNGDEQSGNNGDSSPTKQQGLGDSDCRDDSDSRDGGDSTTSSMDQKMPQAYIKSITEFPLSSGILSFSIVDAATRRYKCGNDNYLLWEEMDDYDEETNSIYCVVLRMFIVQSKSMQECHILYQPTVTEQQDSKTTSSSNDTTPSTITTPPAIVKSRGSDEQPSTGDDDDDGIVVAVKEEQQDLQDSQTLEALLGIAQASTTTSPTPIGTVVPAIARPDSGSPTGAEVVVKSELNQSHNASPQLAAAAAIAASTFPVTQVNLMTPDAFNSSADEKKPTAESSQMNTNVLETLRMLAGVTKTSDSQKQQGTSSLETQKNFKTIDSGTTFTVADLQLASGGSSPSREVQEIMSLQEYEKSIYSGDELLPEEESKKKKKESKKKSRTSSSSKKSKHDLQAATVSDNGTSSSKHSAELQNAVSLITQAVVAQAVAEAVPSQRVGAASGGPPGNVSAELSELSSKMNQLMDLVKVQSMQINNLHNEIADMKKANPMASQKTMYEFCFKLEMQLSKLMEQYLKRYESEHKKKLAIFMSGRDAQNRELRDSFVQIIQQYMMTQFKELIANIIAVELQHHLMPLLTTKVDHMQQQLQVDVAQKLAAFDLVLKENIVQVCQSKNIIDAFSKSVLVGVRESLQAAFIDSMSSTLIPAYEKSSQHMFKQLHDTFSVGIKEFMEQFHSHVQHLQPMQTGAEEVLSQMAGYQQHFDDMLLKNRNAVNETLLEARKDLKSTELMLSRQVQETIRSELRKYCDTQAAALRSQANTPAPMYDLRETIKMLLMQGHINKAFHQALLANDLKLVEFTLRQADQNAVFTPTHCCLEQKVLLSLIQQISADMSNHNEVKQNYLAEALLAIQPADPITREHAPKVLQDLYINCQRFLGTQPKSTQCSNVRMLLKAVEAFKEQF